MIVVVRVITRLASRVAKVSVCCGECECASKEVYGLWMGELDKH